MGQCISLVFPWFNFRGKFFIHPIGCSTKVCACPHRWWKAVRMTDITAGRVALLTFWTTAYTAKKAKKGGPTCQNDSLKVRSYRAETGRRGLSWLAPIESQKLQTPDLSFSILSEGFGRKNSFYKLTTMLLYLVIYWHNSERYPSIKWWSASLTCHCTLP